MMPRARVNKRAIRSRARERTRAHSEGLPKEKERKGLHRERVPTKEEPAIARPSKDKTSLDGARGFYGARERRDRRCYARPS